MKIWLFSCLGFIRVAVGAEEWVGRIAFSIFSDGIYAINTDGTDRKYLARGSRPACSPDGKQILTQGGGRGTFNLINSDGTGFTHLVFERICYDVFGSVAEGASGPRSDLDLAVRGCPPERFYPLLGRLMEELSQPVDLVDLDTETRVAVYLEEEDQLVRVG